MLDTFKQQGFAINTERHEAWYYWGAMCTVTFYARWEPNADNRVGKIDGLFNYRCI